MPTDSTNASPDGGLGTLVLGLIGLVLVCALYFAPYLNARHRSHVNQQAIGALNLLLGWTIIGWIVALIWSLSAQAPRPAVADRPARYCPSCGSGAPSGAYCSSCGARIN